MTSSQVSTKLKTNRNATTHKLNKLAQYKFIRRQPCRMMIKTQEHLIYKYRR